MVNFSPSFLSVQQRRGGRFIFVVRPLYCRAVKEDNKAAAPGIG